MKCFKAEKEQIVLLPVKEAIKIHKKIKSNFYREDRRIYKNKLKGRIVKFNNKHWSGTTGFMADDNYYYICLFNCDEVLPDSLKLGAFHFEFKIILGRILYWFR